MGYYVNIRCSKCRYSFTDGYARKGVSSNLGFPIIVCPNCKTPNLTGKKIWSQMTTSERRQYFLSRVKQTLINALPLFIIVFIVIGKFIGSNISNEGYGILILSGLIAILISSFISFINSWYMINKIEKKYREGDTESVTI